MALQGSLRSLREGNRARVLAILQEEGRLHRAEIARRAGLSRSTVSTIVTDLLAEEMVTEISPDGGGRREHDGRAGAMLTLNSVRGVVLGVDFGLREVRVVLANLAQEVIAQDIAPLSLEAPWPQRLAAGLSTIEDVVQSAGMSYRQLRCVGLGIPDPIDLKSGTVGQTRSDSRPWSGVRAADELALRLGLPVVLDNTSHLAALGEVVWGAGRGVDDIVYLKMSDGVGAGLLLGGRVFRGAIGTAGEIGHVSVDNAGPACPCGNRGCLELYAGTSAILAALRPLRGESLTLQEVLDAADDGDRACRRVIEDAARLTGRVLANVCNILNPALVIVGGELAAAGEVLLEPMRESLARYALSLASSSTRVVPAALGRQAGALGGVAMTLRESDRLGSTYLAEPPPASSAPQASSTPRISQGATRASL